MWERSRLQTPQALLLPYASLSCCHFSSGVFEHCQSLFRRNRPRLPSSSSVPAKANNGADAAQAIKPADPAASKTEVPTHDYSQEAFVVEQYRSNVSF